MNARAQMHVFGLEFFLMNTMIHLITRLLSTGHAPDLEAQGATQWLQVTTNN